MEIENFRKSKGSANPSELARFDVVLEKIGVTLHEFKVLRSKNDGWFVTPPNFSNEKDGVKTWHPYFSITEERKKEFFDKMKELVKVKMEEC